MFCTVGTVKTQQQYVLYRRYSSNTTAIRSVPSVQFKHNNSTFCTVGTVQTQQQYVLYRRYRSNTTALRSVPSVQFKHNSSTFCTVGTVQTQHAVRSVPSVQFKHNTQYVLYRRYSPNTTRSVTVNCCMSEHCTLSAPLRETEISIGSSSSLYETVL